MIKVLWLITRTVYIFVPFLNVLHARYRRQLLIVESSSYLYFFSSPAAHRPEKRYNKKDGHYMIPSELTNNKNNQNRENMFLALLYYFSFCNYSFSYLTRGWYFPDWTQRPPTDWWSLYLWWRAADDRRGRGNCSFVFKKINAPFTGKFLILNLWNFKIILYNKCYIAQYNMYHANHMKRSVAMHNSLASFV